MTEKDFLDKLAQYAVEVMEAVGNEDIKKLAVLAKEFIVDDDEKFQEKTAGVFFENMDVLLKTAAPRSDFGTLMDKQRDNKGELYGNLAKILVGATPLLYYGKKHLDQKSKEEELFRNILSSNKEFRENPEQAMKYFDVLRKYSPGMLDSPEAIENEMLDMHRMGGKSIQADKLRQLAELDEKTNPKKSTTMRKMMELLGAGALGHGIIGLASNLGKSGNPLGGTSGFKLV